MNHLTIVIRHDVDEREYDVNIEHESGDSVRLGAFDTMGEANTFAKKLRELVYNDTPIIIGTY